MNRAPLAAAAAAALLGLAGCGEPIRDDHYSNRAQAAPEAAPAPSVPQAVAVRIGELGPNFDACAAAGITRHLKPGQSLPVRAAPFDSAAETGSVPAGARFFVCTRSHDQKWLGIVFDPAGTLAESCGVSSPVSNRGGYEGPCGSGWVASPFVRLIAGGAEPPVVPATETGGTKGG